MQATLPRHLERNVVAAPTNVLLSPLLHVNNTRLPLYPALQVKKRLRCEFDGIYDSLDFASEEEKDESDDETVRISKRPRIAPDADIYLDAQHSEAETGASVWDTTPNKWNHEGNEAFQCTAAVSPSLHNDAEEPTEYTSGTAAMQAVSAQLTRERAVSSGLQTQLDNLNKKHTKIEKQLRAQLQEKDEQLTTANALVTKQEVAIYDLQQKISELRQELVEARDAPIGIGGGAGCGGTESGLVKRFNEKVKELRAARTHLEKQGEQVAHLIKCAETDKETINKQNTIIQELQAQLKHGAAVKHEPVAVVKLEAAVASATAELSNPTPFPNSHRCLTTDTVLPSGSLAPPARCSSASCPMPAVTSPVSLPVSATRPSVFQEQVAVVQHAIVDLSGYDTQPEE
jgi:hypothetical protein